MEVFKYRYPSFLFDNKPPADKRYHGGVSDFSDYECRYMLN